MASNLVEAVTYEKREEVIDKGKEYERLTAALFILKLCTNDDIQDFYVTTNNKKFRNFDDLEIHATLKSGKQIKFLFQLKYRCNNEKISSNTLTTKFLHYKKQVKNKFFLDNYFEEISKLEEEKEVETFYILYTNVDVKLKEDETLKIENKDSLKVTEVKDLLFKNLLINSKKVNNVCFGFIPINDYPHSRACKKFYLIGSQYDLDQVKSKSEAMLQTMFYCSIYQSYEQFIRNWWIGNFVLYKKQIIITLILIILSPYIKATSNSKQNGKTKMLEKMILDFDITITEEKDKADIYCIWPQFIKEDELKLWQMILQINPYIMSEFQKTKILWCLKKGPLVIDVRDTEPKVLESVLQIMLNHHIKRSIILMGKPKDLKFDGNIFHTLFDLYQSLKPDNNLFYLGLTQNYRISIQGKEPITLEELLQIDIKFSQKITLQDLLTMSQKELLCVGEPLNDVPLLHVERTLSVWMVNIEELLEISQSVLIVKCNSFSKRRIQMCASTTNQKFVFVSDSNKIAQQFDKLSQKRSNVYAFEQIDDGNFVLILQKGGLPLKYRKHLQDVDVSKLDTFVNVLCAPPGMGKSQLVKYLRKQSKKDDWTLYVELSKLNSFLAKNPTYEQFKSKILFLDNETDNLNKHFISLLFKKEKVIVYLDGLDDINSSYVGITLEFLKMFIMEGGRIWLSSRENLREKLSVALGAAPIDILHFDNKQRVCYIHDKLKQQYSNEDLKQVGRVLSNSLQFTNSQELLGVPLQLHLLTEVFLNNREVYERLKKQKVFVLTQMYQLFFQGKIEMVFKRKRIDKFEAADLRLDYLQLKKYEIPALTACLERDDFDKLEIQRFDDDFIKEFQDGDKFGIIKIINKDEAVFHHQTYAEYFASIWFTKNQNKLLLLKKELFGRKYTNLRRMIDIKLAEENPIHLSIIYKNLNNLPQNLEEVDQAGRTIAHLAFSYIDKTEFSKSDTKVMDEICKHPTILHIKDNLLNATPVKYALLSKCLYPLEKYLQHNACSHDFLKEVFKHFDTEHLVKEVLNSGFCFMMKKLLQIDDLSNRFEGNSFLHLASLKENNIDMLETLISKGTFVDCKNLEEETPLLVAVKNHCVNNVRFLLRQGASSIEFDNKGKCPVFQAFALKPPNTELVKVFSEFGFDLNITDRDKNTLLHVACQEECLENVKTIISANKKMSLDLKINAKNKHKNTPLLLACKKGCIKNVMLLYENNGDVKATNNNRNNALHSASYYHKPNVEVMSFLLEHGLNVNDVDNDGDTPFLEACERACIENVKFLMENGANVKVVNNEGQNALHRASSATVGNVEIINLLIKHDNTSKNEGGLDVNSKDIYGNTPLLYACAGGCIENIMALIEHGADIFVQNNFNFNALHIASNAKEVDTEVLDLLLCYGLTLEV